MNPERKRLTTDQWITAGIFAVAFLIRVSFLGSLASDPTFVLPIIDSSEFGLWASSILESQFFWAEVTNHTPLYPYFVAAIYAVFGYSSVAVAVVQYLLAAASAAMLYQLALRLLDRPAALTASLLLAGYWLFICVGSYLYSETLSLALNLALLTVLLLVRDSPSKYLAAGVLFGLSVLCRPGVMFFGVTLLVWLLILRLPRRDVGRYFGAFCVAPTLLIGSVLLYNYHLTDQLMLRTQMGANVYMGNHPDYRGTNIHVQIGAKWRTLSLVPYDVTGRREEMSESELNSIYISETLRVIGERPGEWISVLLGKAYSIVTGREFLWSPDVFFLERHLEGSPLRWVNTRLISILAAVGMVLAWLHERKKFLLVYLFLLGASILIFFPAKTRYFIPMMPAVLLFAGYTVSRLIHHVRQREFRPAGIVVAGLVVVALLSRFNPLAFEAPDTSETYLAIAGNLAGIGDESAAQYFRQALEMNPLNTAALNDFALFRERRGEHEAAMQLMQRAITIDPGDEFLQSSYQRMIDRSESRH